MKILKVLEFPDVPLHPFPTFPLPNSDASGVSSDLSPETVSLSSISPPPIDRSQTLTQELTQEQEKQTKDYIRYLSMFEDEEGKSLFEITENTEGGSGDKVYIIKGENIGYVLKVFQKPDDYMSELGNIQRFIQASDEACGSYFTMEVIDADRWHPRQPNPLCPS